MHDFRIIHAGYIFFSVADQDPFDKDPDPAFHFNMDPDPAFQYETDPDPTVCYGSGSGSLAMERGNVLRRYFLYIFT